MKKKDCNCLMCASTCPECGSYAIRVRYSVAFEYENDTEDEISISREDDDIEIECFDCGESFKSTYGSNYDERLDRLWNTLDSTIKIPENIRGHIKNGKIKISHH